MDKLIKIKKEVSLGLHHFYLYYKSWIGNSATFMEIDSSGAINKILNVGDNFIRKTLKQTIFSQLVFLLHFKHFKVPPCCTSFLVYLECQMWCLYIEPNQPNMAHNITVVYLYKKIGVIKFKVGLRPRLPLGFVSVIEKVHCIYNAQT